jgi:hypothetical protein
MNVCFEARMSIVSQSRRTRTSTVRSSGTPDRLGREFDFFARRLD